MSGWHLHLSVEFEDGEPVFCAEAYDQDDAKSVCGWSANSFQELFNLIRNSAKEKAKR